MTVLLFLTAGWLTATKVQHDLDAWTERSSRTTDLVAFAVVLTVLLVAAFALTGTGAAPEALTLPTTPFYV